MSRSPQGSEPRQRDPRKGRWALTRMIGINRADISALLRRSDQGRGAGRPLAKRRCVLLTLSAAPSGRVADCRPGRIKFLRTAVKEIIDGARRDVAVVARLKDPGLVGDATHLL